MSDDSLYTPGWVQDPEAVAVVVGAQPQPYFSMTGAADRETIPPAVFLWQAREKLTGQPWPSRNQGKVGSCVSFGTAAAIEATMAAEVLAGEPESIRDLCQEVIYAGSRVEVGGGKLGGSDGSIGAWAAEFVRRWGVLDRSVYGKYDLSQYDEARCRNWGKTGVPDDLEPEARKYPVKSITMVKTWREAKEALASGYGISVSSTVGFAMKRDSEGFASPSGRWAHCMALLGYQEEKREGGWICNSWGPDAHTGPLGSGNPPPCGFWADASVIEKMLRMEDSWAFSALQGFPARRLKWYV